MTELEKIKELEDRVMKFKTLSLPGQPMMMHMGTSSLVGDLWQMVTDLYAEAAAAPAEEK